ncbi:MAG: GNAT family N-acetyltransferase [Planctomycetota bacterium]
MDSPRPVFTVRPATPGDIAAVHAFLRPFVAAGRVLDRTMEELDQLVRTGFVAEESEQRIANSEQEAKASGGREPSGRSTGSPRVVGFATLEIYSPKLAEVRSLCVAADRQGRGIGKALVTACVGLAKERNVLEVMAITSNEDFFKTCGFDFTLPGEKKALFLQTRE